MPFPPPAREDGAVSVEPEVERAVGEESTGRATTGKWRLFIAGALTGLTGIATSEVVRALLHRRDGPGRRGRRVRCATRHRGRSPCPWCTWSSTSTSRCWSPARSSSCWRCPGSPAILHVRRPWLGYLLLTALAAVALLALLSRDGSSQYDVIPLAVGFITWLVVLPWLTSAAARRPRCSPQRRAFLTRAAGVGAGRWSDRAGPGARQGPGEGRAGPRHAAAAR